MSRSVAALTARSFVPVEPESITVGEAATPAVDLD